jgi:predicted nucleic acid-binding protein
VSLCYLDSNFLLSHLRQSETSPDPRFDPWRQATVEEIGPDRAVISALVLDEVVYRAVVTWLKELGDRDPITTYRRTTRDAMQRVRPRLRTLWTAIDSLDLETMATDQAVIDRARHLMDAERLGARDAFHAAHAIEKGCDWIVTADSDFDGLTEIRRLGPAAR